jgi:hypothetical protein
MAKVLFENRWYEEVAPTGVYESVYEAMVKAHAIYLWPRFHAVHFKANVYAGMAGVKADFVLVERNYSEWWVVEVEMEHHSLEGHVLPQTRKLGEAAYGDSEAEKLCEMCPALDLAKVKAMFRDHPPRVLVVVNKPRPDWVKPLANVDAMVAVFEIFRSDQDQHLFRVNGDHPVGTAELVSVCRFDELMNRWLLVENPISLRTPGQKKIMIEFNGHTTEWTRYAAAGKVWLYTESGPNPLPDRFDYELTRRGDGQLAFQQVTRSRKR